MHTRRPGIALDWRTAARIALACIFAHAGSAPAADDATISSPRERPSATLKKARPAFARNTRVAPAAVESTVDVRATAPVVSVTGVAPGQAGYVHFFIVRAPGGGEWETGVGIEMPDQRIAWSFLDLGVVVSPFIETGFVEVKRRPYEVQYLYGLRPFPDAASMRTLQAEIEARVLPWAESETPYCILRGPSDDICVSCLGFVLRILFPGPTPAYALLPRDFAHAEPKSIYNTDDFLVYLAGLHGMSDRNARLKRVDELALPENLREDVVRLINTAAADRSVADAAAEKSRSTAPRPAAQRAPQPGKS